MESYIFYGAYASYFSAKVRAYLRKKGIPFSERLPHDPLFRSKVRPESGTHRIPQLLTPEGEVVQDSVEIVDFLEKRFPAIPAFPEGPRQRIFVHLMELMGSEGLLRLAWMHRWLFDENQPFVKMDFGRALVPQGTDAELLKYGDVIADQMKSYGLPEGGPEVRKSLDEQYRSLLALFEAHLIEHPYLLGGHPSAADYAIMGALHAHMGRDPAGLRVMQDHAPRTFRWVEHMMVPDIPSPEFFSRPVEYLADDVVPETALAILRFIAERYGRGFVLDSIGFDQAMEAIGATSGHAVDSEVDQPFLRVEKVRYAGRERDHNVNIHAVWITQRAQRCYQSRSEAEKASVDAMLGTGIARDLLQVPVRFELAREKNRLVVR